MKKCSGKLLKVKMHGYCVTFCIIVLLGLCIKNTNGQTNATSNSTQLTTNTKPVTSNIYQTEGFASDNILSGPLLVIDKKTVFISNLNYVSKSDDTYFWAGVDKPSSNGVLVPDENSSRKPLKSYQEKNIYLQLPENLTTDKIDYIAVWDVKSKTDLGHIMLFSGNDSEARNSVPDALGYHNKTKDNKPVFRIPLCCGINEIYLSHNTCIPVETDLTFNLRVFNSNETHVDPEQLLDNIEFAPYKYVDQCTKENYIRILLEPEETLGLIYNSSLLYYLTPDDYGILSHGSYCVLYFNISLQDIAICIKDEPNTVGASIQYLYLPFLIISTICFFVSAIIYIFILKAKDIHRKCLVGYLISMIVTFISLISLQNMSGACNFIGGLFMFSMICSFVWLACLCIDLIYVVKSVGRGTEDDARIYIYLSLSLVIPAIFLIISLAPDGVVDIPKSFVKTYSGDDTCIFEDAKIGVFFIPIGLLILVSVCGLGYTSYIINHPANNDPNKIEWMHNKSRFKFMSRSCFLVWITTFIWLIEALASIELMGTAIHYAIDLIEALQGVFVTIIFVLNKYAAKEIRDVIYKKRNEIELQSTMQDLLNNFDRSNATNENNIHSKIEDK